MTTKESAPLRLDGIVRVSKTGDRDYLRSPDQQEADLQRWADRMGHELVHVHVAIDESAGHGAHPAIEAAKERALAGVTDGVVAPYLSRFSRHTVYGLETVSDLLGAGKEFFALDCPFDLRTPEGEKYLTDKLADARYEWRRLRDSFARGVRESIERGVHIGVPFGFQRSDGKGSPLAIDEDEAPAVRMAYELRADGHSWQAVADALNASGIMPRPYTRDGVLQQAVWTYKTVRQLVVGRDGNGNVVYLGTAWNGEHSTPGAHPAIVDEGVFLAANDARGTKPVGPDEGHLLSGLVRCKACGYAMTYNGADFLRCRAAQHGAGKCPDPAGVNARQLEAVVLAEFKARYLDVELEVHEADDAVDAASADVARLAIRHAALLDAMPDDMTGKAGENWRAREREAREALADAERHEGEAKAKARGASNVPADLSADDVDAMLARGEIADVRTFLAAVFAAIVVRRPNRWREPVLARTRILRRDQAPTNSTALIAHVSAA